MFAKERKKKKASETKSASDSFRRFSKISGKSQVRLANLISPLGQFSKDSIWLN